MEMLWLPPRLGTPRMCPALFKTDLVSTYVSSVEDRHCNESLSGIVALVISLIIADYE